MSVSRQVPIQEASLIDLRAAVERAVIRVCPPEMADRRDDLVQKAMLRVMKKQARSEGNGPLASLYLSKVAYSTLVDEWRRLGRRREVPLDESDVIAWQRSREPLPDATCEGRELGHAIHVCLEAMARDRRLAVVLHLQGHTVRETAKILGWRFKRTENLVYRGLHDLRGCLSAKGFEP